MFTSKPTPCNPWACGSFQYTYQGLNGDGIPTVGAKQPLRPLARWARHAKPSGAGRVPRCREQVAALGQEFVVQPCFLELAQPEIATGVRQLLDQGIDRLVVVPVLLFAAGHAKRDIPAAVAAALRDQPPIARHRTATAGRAAAEAGLIVGNSPRWNATHASLNYRPSDSTRRFPIVRRSPLPIRCCSWLPAAVRCPRPSKRCISSRNFEYSRRRSVSAKPASWQVARPTFQETLTWAAQSDFRRIVVQPHLLFSGDVLTEITDAVSDFARRQPHREWIVTSHLGPSPPWQKPFWNWPAARIDPSYIARLWQSGGTEVRCPWSVVPCPWLRRLPDVGDFPQPRTKDK